MTDQPGCLCSICAEDYVNQSDGRGSIGQSADLRTRIAKATRPHTDLGNRCTCGWKWPTGCRFDVEQYDLHLADVLIREIGLREERGDKQRPIHVCATLGLYHRYVTEWKADE